MRLRTLTCFLSPTSWPIVADVISNEFHALDSTTEDHLHPRCSQSHYRAPRLARASRGGRQCTWNWWPSRNLTPPISVCQIVASNHLVDVSVTVSDAQQAVHRHDGVEGATPSCPAELPEKSGGDRCWYPVRRRWSVTYAVFLRSR